MNKDLFIAINLFKLLLIKKFKQIWKISDGIIVLIGIFFVSYSLTKLYSFVVSTNLPINLNFTYILIGTILGITIFSNQYNQEELKFLFLQTYNIPMLSWYYILNILFPLLGIIFMFVMSLFLWNGSITFILNFHIEIILGYFVEGNLSYYFNLSKKMKIISSMSNLLILVPSCINGYLEIKIITGIFFIILVLKFSSYNLKGYMTRKHSLKKKQQIYFCSKKPVLKKELIIMFKFQRFFPLLILLVGSQFVFYITKELNLGNFVIITLILIILMNDTWTLNIIGLEESTIFIYVYSQLSLKKLILFKWLNCFSLISVISIFNYILWGVYYNASINIINIIILIMFNYLISINYICISIYFADFNRRTYYRVNIKGIIVSVICTIFIFCSYLISVKLVIVEILLITFIFIKLIKTVDKLRSFFYNA